MNQSINTTQAKEIYQGFINQYLNSSLDSLANLGQRFGIKADDITYRDLSLENIFTNITENKENYIVKITKNNVGQMFFNLINTKDKFDTFAKDTNDNPEFVDNIKIDSNLLIDTIYGIEEYHPDSFMSIDGETGTLTCFLKGRYNQYNNQSLGCIIYLQYNINTNAITHYINTSYYGKYNNSDGYFLLQQLDLNEIKNEENIYKFNVYLFNIEDLAKEINSIYTDISEETARNILFDLYRFDYEEKQDDNTYVASLGPELFSPFNIKYRDYEKLVKGNYNTYDYDNTPFIKFIVNTPKYKYNLSDVNLYYKKEDINNYEFNSDDLVQLLGIYNNFTLNNYTYGLNKLHNVYHNLYYKYNSESIYKSTKIFYSYIISSLYDKLSNEITEKDNDDALYIPLTYKIHVISGENLFNIYFSSPIYVSYTHDNEYYSTSKIIFYNKTTYNRTSSYVIEFVYNKEFGDILNYIYISKQYTLPYINSLNNWVINDEDTVNSSEYNELNGIKEILLHVKSLTEQNTDIDILNSDDVSVKQYFNKYRITEFIINPKYFNKYANITNITCKTKVPVIDTSLNKNFFENTVLVILTDKSNIIGNYSQDYTLEYVYSLWKLNNKTNEFEYISLEDNYAYDPYNDPKTYRNKEYKENISLLVPANNNLINTENISGDNYYLNIRNKKAKYYNAKDYNNDYNTILEYVSNAKEDASNPIYESSKYLNNLAEGIIQTTNTLYPKNVLELTIDKESYSESSIRSLTKYYNTISIYTTEDNVSIISDNVIHIDDITREINNYFVENPTSKLTLSATSSTEYYEEYLFNENVPLIDLKEIFIANHNVLNRTNILSLDNNGNIYNAYLGSDNNESEKDTLYLSTSNTNINIGYDTLLNSSETGNFKKFKNLIINEFNNITLSAKENVNINGNLTFDKNPIYNINNISYGSIIPSGNIDNRPLQIYMGNNIDQSYHDLKFGVYYTDNNDQNLGLFTTQNIFYKTELIKVNSSDADIQYEVVNNYICINLNSLFRQMFGFDIKNDYTFESDESSIMILDVYQNNETQTVTESYYPDNDIIYPVFFLVINRIEAINDNSSRLTNYILNHKLNIAIKGNVIKVNFENDRYNEIDEYNDIFTKTIINDYTLLRYKFINTFGQITPLEN